MFPLSAAEQVPAVLPEECEREEAVLRRVPERRQGRPGDRRGVLLLGYGVQVKVGQDTADVVGRLEHVGLYQRRKPARTSGQLRFYGFVLGDLWRGPLCFYMLISSNR